MTEIQIQFGIAICVLSSYNALECFSSPFCTFMTQRRIIHQSSCNDTPQQNNVAERKNRHLMEVTHALLFEMHVPKPFWKDAVFTCNLINRMPSYVLHRTVPFSLLFPSQILFSLPPRVFGCVCFVCDHRPNMTKLDPKAIKCLFVCYFHTQKGNCCYSADLKRYFISSNVTFF